MMISSTILKTAMRLLVPLSLMFAIYMSLKGHNEPGGGFIAGLIAAVAVCMYRMAMGPQALYRLMPFHPRWLVCFGLALAFATCVTPLFFGHAFLRSAHGSLTVVGEQIHWASAVAFDTGVLLVVIGVSVGMITRLSEELES